MQNIRATSRMPKWKRYQNGIGLRAQIVQKPNNTYYRISLSFSCY